MDEKYFDAKFDGLEKLMLTYNSNLSEHIHSVNREVKQLQNDLILHGKDCPIGRNIRILERDLSEHKESTAAHGIDASERNTSKIVSWLGLGLAAAVGAIEALKK